MKENSSPNSSEKRLPVVTISTEKKGYLVKLEPLQKLIECALISPYIKGEKPVSLAHGRANPKKTGHSFDKYRKNSIIIPLDVERLASFSNIERGGV